jgi:ArsR family transcriptional regulator, arsenate/arsenite/antimonite-responsive transcriptional repressor
MEKLTNIFKALSDPNRLRILKMLELRPLCVCEMTAVLGLATSTVSKHLSVLRENGLLIDEKEGKWVTYRLQLDLDNAYLRMILPLLRGWMTEDETILQDREKLNNLTRYTICSTENK